MTARSQFKLHHRLARLGALGSLAIGLPSKEYQWFLHEVYDLRFPHIGSERHYAPRSYDSLRGKLVKRNGKYQRIIYF